MKTIQNITISISADVLQKAKVLAVQKNTSLSQLVTQALVGLFHKQDNHDQARCRNVALLKSGLNMETQGKTGWTKADMHRTGNPCIGKE